MSKAELIDISGQKFHRLTVLRFAYMGNRRRSYWECRCDCGNIVTLRKDAFAYSYSKAKSCGCWHREESGKRKKDPESGKYIVQGDTIKAQHLQPVAP